MNHKLSMSPTEISRIEQGTRSMVTDFVSVEEPLEIRLNQANSIAITMRTPGNDHELAIGFLFTEGIIRGKEDIRDWTVENDQSKININLAAGVHIDLKSLERHFYTTSSCGVCGKTSIEAVQAQCRIALPQTQWKVTTSTLFSLPLKLRDAQSNFEQTGGIHGCAMFSLTGEILKMSEDVGRHNALDKLIGRFVLEQEKTDGIFEALSEQILLLSGRISFELVQKSAMAGIRMIAAVGAPSSLAVDLADELGITLIGFLRGERCNIYSHPQRVENQTT